jgi:hypothetical protein
MAHEQAKIVLNFTALQANFRRALQHQLDIIKVLQIGCDNVTAEQVANEPAFGSFVPANGAQLEHEAARIAAHDWLLRGFVRDAIEATCLFLDECLHVCQLIVFAAKGKVNKTELDQLLRDGQTVNHGLPFPKKLSTMADDFGVSTQFDPHLLSLNRARNCLVHRLGRVGRRDADDDGLMRVQLHRVEFLVIGSETGTVLILEPGLTVPEPSSLAVRFIDHTRTFAVGDLIRFDSRELYDTTITLFRYGEELARSIEEFARASGIAESPDDKV